MVTRIAAGTQSVAIQLCADHSPVGEGHRRRAVPRLHQRGVVFVERLDVLGHGGVVIPGFRNQHGHHVRQGAPGKRQQLHGVVEHGRIAAARGDDRQQLLDVVAEQRRRQHRLPRVHPVHVSAQRVDFAVVADVAVRVRQLPARKRVGRKALVHQAQRAGQFGIQQLLIEIGDLRREQQSLVDNRARGKRRNVEEILLLQIGLGHGRFRALAHHVQLALERVLVHARRRCG